MKISVVSFFKVLAGSALKAKKPQQGLLFLHLDNFEGGVCSFMQNADNLLDNLKILINNHGIYLVLTLVLSLLPFALFKI